MEAFRQGLALSHSYSERPVQAAQAASASSAVDRAGETAAARLPPHRIGMDGQPAKRRIAQFRLPRRATPRLARQVVQRCSIRRENVPHRAVQTAARGFGAENRPCPAPGKGNRKTDSQLFTRTAGRIPMPSATSGICSFEASRPHPVPTCDAGRGDRRGDANCVYSPWSSNCRSADAAPRVEPRTTPNPPSRSRAPLENTASRCLLSSIARRQCPPCETAAKCIRAKNVGFDSAGGGKGLDRRRVVVSPWARACPPVRTAAWPAILP